MQQPQEINHRLDQIENEIGLFDLEPKGGSNQLLTHMDEVAKLIFAEGWGPESLKAERSQFENIKANLKNRAGKIIKAAGGSQAYQQERDRRHPPVENEWWYLDGYLKAKQREFVRKTSIRVAVAALVIIILIVVYQRFFAPDPKLIAKLNYQNAAVDALLKHQYQQGLTEANLALPYSPMDMESLDLKGMALMKLGQAGAADQVFLLAQQSAGGMVNFYVTRSLEWLTVNEPGLALVDAQQAVQVDPNSLEAYWYRGKAEVLLGKYQNANDDFNQAINLANQQNQLVLLVQIKGDLADLMQIMQ